MIKHICKKCDKDFLSEHSTSKFCSHKCFTDNRRIDLNRECETCKIIFDQRNSKGRYKTKRFCSVMCRFVYIGKTKAGKPHPHSPETRRKMSESQRGEKGNNWKGGITKITELARHNVEYKLWRKAVFERDNYTCMACNDRNGNGKEIILNADHVKPFALFPELRFAIDNGITLCVPCHKKTDTYGGKIQNYKRYLATESLPSTPY